MSRISLFSLSLAAKCRLLFGLAVLLIVSAAIFVPWLRMRDLVHESNVQETRFIGRLAIAQCDWPSGNWELQQQALQQWWQSEASRYGIRGPAPQFIAVPDPLSPAPPPDSDNYTKEAIGWLIEEPTLSEAFPYVEQRDGELVYRIIFPVRSLGGQYPPGTLLGAVSVQNPVPRARVELWINLGLSLMAGALAGILAILVFYLITQKLILSPVRELTKVAESVSQGEHSIRSQVATGDEYEELARAFNAMLSHLQATENELRTINKSLDTRLSEMAERNVALFEANKVKSQFLTNVSHELRTPLTSIIGFAELLREATSTDGGRMLRYTENILSSGRLLLGIINDLLDLAKIEAGKMELHLTAMALAEIARNLVDLMRPVADKKSLQLVTVIPEDLPKIVSDPGRLQQVLYNLLSNAVKFTPNGGRVELRLERTEEEGMRIAVRDTGIGIAKDKLPLIFEKFWQLDESMTREHSGTGLGLAISKELMTLLGGSIHAESEEGKGSTFTLILPPNPPTPAETAAPRLVNLT